MTCSLFLVIFLSFFVHRSVSDPRATEAALICGNRTATASQRQVVVANFVAAMKRLTPDVTRQRYSTVVIGSGNTTVYAFGECMKDLSQKDCNLCFAQVKTRILNCLPFQLVTRGGRVYYDGCYLRYDDYNFFNESLSAQDLAKCGNKNYGGNKTVFGLNAFALVRNLSVDGPKNDGFSAGFVSRKNVTVYGLAQCWELVKESGCRNCLADAVSKIGSCVPKEEGRVLNAGCYLRYSTQKFYNNSEPDATVGNGGGNKLAIILAATFAGLAFVVIAATTIFSLRKRIVKKRKERKQLGALVATVNKSKLYFSYETLEKATNYFHVSNKLGQGGAGAVYKGILPDGRVVAVKRLFFVTKQWVDHLFNEVNLISGICHKNLVTLLGCSIAGPESLLVYEYLPNQSLHDYIFVRKEVEPLDWETRCKIILGTAKGLTHLHEESKLRIIHRDIKLSNILLDEDFTPKIADFGLARLFPEDKTHVSTALAGTLGYMAPEYIVRGKLTEKVDIYSFGVVLIEIVCGRKNNSYLQDSYSILQKVWNLYGDGRLCDAVDPCLPANFQPEDASRLLQIGLLCIQAEAELRPPMSTVVKMLTNDHEIANPAQPPFLHSSSVNVTPLVQSGSDKNRQPNSKSNSQSSGGNMTESWIEPR